MLTHIPPNLKRVERFLDASPRAPVLGGPVKETQHVVREGVEELGAAVGPEPRRRARRRRERDAASAACAGRAQHVRLQQAVGVRVLVIVVVVVVVVVAVVARVLRCRAADAVVVVVVHVFLRRTAGGGGGGGEEEPKDVRWRGVLHGRVLIRCDVTVLATPSVCFGRGKRENDVGESGLCVCAGGSEVSEPCGALANADGKPRSD